MKKTRKEGNKYGEGLREWKGGSVKDKVEKKNGKRKEKKSKHGNMKGKKMSKERKKEKKTANGIKNAAIRKERN